MQESKKDSKETRVESAFNGVDQYLDLKTMLSQEKDRIEINPSQDYANGNLIIGREVEDKIYLFSSNNEILDPLKNQNIKMKTDHLNYQNFSSEGLTDYVNGIIIEPNEVFDEVRKVVRDYVYCTDPIIYDLLSIWTMGTYCFRIFQSYPYLWINGQKATGKSMLLSILANIAFNGVMTSHITPAALYRSIEQDSATILIDEVEKLRSKDKNSMNFLMRILNSGYSQEAKSLVCNHNGGVDHYDVYGPKVLAGINEIDPVVRSRTIMIQSVKKPGSVFKKRKRPTDLKAVRQKCNDMLMNYALNSASQLQAVYNNIDDYIDVPSYIENRDLDLWEPLLTIAYLIEAKNGDMTLINHLLNYAKKNYNSAEIEKKSFEKKELLRSTFEKYIQEHKPLKTVKGKEYYSTEDVFNFFRQFNEFEVLDNQKWFTRHLKEHLPIDSKQVRIDGTRYQCYFFIREDIVEEKECDVEEKYEVLF
jgi:hypothetical protein